MKRVSQLKAIKSIRKPIPPATRVERPKRGGGYRRKPRIKNTDDWEAWQNA